MSGSAKDEVAADPRAKRREYERQYRERNRERLREYQRERYRADPQKAMALVKKYQASEKGIAARKAFAQTPKRKVWVAAYRPKATENNRRWYYRNHDKAKLLKRINQRTRLDREANAAGSATTEQLYQRAKLWGFACWICCGEWRGTMDHVIPLALGGTNWPANRRPICKACNERKGAKHYKAFVGG